MNIIRQVAELKEELNSFRNRQKAIGFVPTMGALHQGHLSLIEESKANTGVTVCSIFVNPAQFNDPKDYEKYPNTIDKDLLILRQAGAGIVFIPPVNEVYPDGTKDLEHYDLGYLETILEGHYRPGHFQGVSQVMSRLLKMVLPDQLFMGQKDYQQCMVIQKLLHLTQLDQHISLQVCPTVRESDGLAMSSRNLRLSQEQRKLANSIFNELNYIKQHLHDQSLQDLKKDGIDHLVQKGFKVDYIEIANVDDLSPATSSSGKLVALAAASTGNIRLIDNIILN